jgi:hypothetical protein
MYYRVAIRRQGDQRDRPPTWQWKSTVLTSLQTLFQFLRLYGALPLCRKSAYESSPPHHGGVWKSSSRKRTKGLAPIRSRQHNSSRRG